MAALADTVKRAAPLTLPGLASYGSSNGTTFDSGSGHGMTPLPPMPTPRSRSNSFSMQLDNRHSISGGLPNLPPLPPLSSSKGCLSGRFPDLPSLPPSFGSSPAKPAPGFPALPLSPASPLLGLCRTPTASADAPAEPSRSHQSKGIRRFTKRTTFSTAQIDLMEEVWRITEYPSVEQIDLCAEKAGLLPKQVRTWWV